MFEIEHRLPGELGDDGYAEEMLRDALRLRLVRELMAFICIPNSVSRPAEIRQNARYLSSMLARRGIRSQLWPTPSGRPLVYGELPAKGATQTLLFYSHYDGVPADAEAWHADPYTPVLRSHRPGRNANWRALALPDDGRLDPSWHLYGRSAAASKGAIVALIGALDVLRANGLQPRVNLKFLFDGELAHGSPGLRDTLDEHAHELASDLLLSVVGEIHQSGRPTVELGARGLLACRLTVYTAAMMHSGHFGNSVPSAALRLAQLLVSLKHQDGTIAIPAFYDEIVPLTESEQEAIACLPPMQERFGIAGPENDGRPLGELIGLPTLNVRGVSSGLTGLEAPNSIPHSATAALDIQLVDGMQPALTYRRLIDHLLNAGWMVLGREPIDTELRRYPLLVRLEPEVMFPAARSSPDLPLIQAAVDTIARATGEAVAVLPSGTNSVPLACFEHYGLPCINVPLAHDGAHQHGPDESLRLGAFFRAIDSFSALFRTSLLTIPGGARRDTAYT